MRPRQSGQNDEPGFDATEPQPLLLEVDDLSVEFRTSRSPVRAVRGISYALHQGEVLGIVGESGSGKSVSVLALMGLLPRLASTIVRGSARLNGREILGLSERQFRSIRATQMSMVFQDPLSSLNPRTTIGDQVGETLRIHRGLSRAAARRRVIELLELVEIPAASRRVDSYPHQFSGGMRQRAMLAMAISCEPSILIADEPTSALDVTVQAQILDLILELRERLGMAVILITHDLGVVAGFADRVAVMYGGRLAEHNDTRSVLAHPRHPYTSALIRSVPVLYGRGSQALFHIEGAPPDPSVEIHGCAFEPRCDFAVEKCRVDEPQLVPAGNGAVACWVRPNLTLESRDA